MIWMPMWQKPWRHRYPVRWHSPQILTVPEAADRVVNAALEALVA